MSKSGAAFMEQDIMPIDGESQGDSIDPEAFAAEESALYNAFQAIHYILTEEEVIKVFGGLGFVDFAEWRDGLRK